jgi:replication factor A1
MLRGWYDNEGVNLEMQSLSMAKSGQGGAPWKILGEANQIDNVASHDKGDYYMCKVVVGSIKKDNAMYKACPEANCNKKVIDNNNGYYRCEKCGKEYQDFKWRAMVSVNFIDASDNVYATAFQEAAELILENKVETLGPMFNDDPDGFAAIIKESVFKPYIGKFRCKMESYNNENRLKHSVVELHSMSFAEYARKLLNEIKECTA